MHQVVYGFGSLNALFYRKDCPNLFYLIVCQFVCGAFLKLETCCTLADAFLIFSVPYMTWELVLMQVEGHV